MRPALPAIATLLALAACHPAAERPSARAGEGGGAPESGCAALEGKLDAALAEAVRAQGLPGAAAAVEAPGCRWRGAAGLADVATNEALAPGALFRAGSITKTFVASLALLLHRDGALGLDEPAARWVAGLPGGDAITVRQLLDHTSGLFDFTENDDFWAAAEADPTRVWKPEELIAFAAAKPAYFAPGQGWQYSNTDYIAAGVVLEAASGKPLGELLEERILAPHRLSGTYLAGAEPPVPGLVRGYGKIGGKLVDTTSAFDPSAAGAAGALVSTTRDLASFFGRLLGGQVLEPAELGEMTRWVKTSWPDLPRYGLGLGQRSFALGLADGHEGGIWGFVSASYAAVDRGTTITALVNLESGDARAIVDSLAKILEAR